MMNRFVKAAIIAASLCWSVAAQAAPALTHIGSNTAASGSTVALTGVTIANGDLVLVGGLVRTGVAGDTTTVTDSAGDTFTLYEFPASGVGSIRTFVAFAKTTGLSSGSVTVTTTGTISAAGLSVEDVSGFNTTTPEDTGVKATASATSAAPTITSGAAAQANDLLYSSFQYGNQTYTEDGTWTNTANNVGNANGKFATGYIINAGTAAVTRTGAISSALWRGIVIGIAPTPGAVTLKGGTLLRGAGR